MGQKPLRRVPLFFGEHPLTIDPKNRLLIPSQVRRAIDVEVEGNKLFVILRNSVPWFYPSGFYTRLLNYQVGPDLSPSEELLDYTHYKLSLAEELEWDRQGRVVLPDAMLKSANVGKEVTLIGAKDHLELWSRDQWLQRKQWLIAQSSKIERWAQDNLRQPPSAGRTETRLPQRETKNQ
jgi:transcriptional regulator MraZ